MQTIEKEPKTLRAEFRLTTREQLEHRFRFASFRFEINKRYRRTLGAGHGPNFFCRWRSGRICRAMHGICKREWSLSMPPNAASR
jgi:hypothetical protein